MILVIEKERLDLPPSYRLVGNVQIYNVVTKPEIEILHIYAVGLTDEFERVLQGTFRQESTS